MTSVFLYEINSKLFVQYVFTLTSPGAKNSADSVCKKRLSANACINKMSRKTNLCIDG